MSFLTQGTLWVTAGATVSLIGPIIYMAVNPLYSAITHFFTITTPAPTQGPWTGFKVKQRLLSLSYHDNPPHPIKKLTPDNYNNLLANNFNDCIFVILRNANRGLFTPPPAACRHEMIIIVKVGKECTQLVCCCWGIFGFYWIICDAISPVKSCHFHQDTRHVSHRQLRPRAPGK